MVTSITWAQSMEPSALVNDGWLFRGFEHQPVATVQIHGERPTLVRHPRMRSASHPFCDVLRIEKLGLSARELLGRRNSQFSRGALGLSTKRFDTPGCQLPSCMLTGLHRQRGFCTGRLQAASLAYRICGMPGRLGAIAHRGCCSYRGFTRIFAHPSEMEAA